MTNKGKMDMHFNPPWFTEVNKTGKIGTTVAVRHILLM